MTETKTPETGYHPHGTILIQHGKATALVAALRKGCVFQHVPLIAKFPAWEEARAEATEKFPGVTFFVPRLGEMPPS